MTEERNRAIGQELQDARLEKGLTLDDVQQQTKIQKRYLAAIENGQFDQLPGSFYERAFVRQYATVVGLDVAHLMENYEIEQKSVRPDLSSARVDADNVTRTGMHIEEETAAEKTRQYLPKIIVGIIIVAVIGVIWFVFARYMGETDNSATESSVSVTTSKVASSSSKASTESTKAKAKKNSAEKKSDKVEKTEISAPSVSGSTSTLTITPAKKSDDSNLVIVATEKAWLSVTDNSGKALFSGVVESNENKSVTIPADVTSLKVQLGNAAATSLKVDDQNVDLGSGSNLVWAGTLNFER